MEGKSKVISHPDSPMDGPADGVMMKTDCIRTDFFQSPAENGAMFQQRDKGAASITASMELGTFSIRDRQSNVMLTVSIMEAMEVLAEAMDRAKKEEAGCQEETQEDVHTAEDGYCS